MADHIDNIGEELLLLLLLLLLLQLQLQLQLQLLRASLPSPKATG